MAPTHDSEKVRLTPQQREALERRSRMTQRRQELATRIRKQKKSQYLQKKRGLAFVSESSVVHENLPNEFQRVLESYCRDLTAPEQLLPKVQDFVAGSNNRIRSAEDPLVLLKNTEERLALQFLDCLRQQILEAITSNNEISFRSILRVLVYLTSMSSGDGIGPLSTEYYGRHPATWSELMVSPSPLQATPWLEIFVQSLSSLREVELTSLILGNLVGDDGAAGTVFHALTDELKTSLVCGLIRSVSPTTPTAAWTLTNMIRNDPVSYGRAYCSETLLSPSRLTSWLNEPTLATQTAWMIASLTDREEETAQYLSGKHPEYQQSIFLATTINCIRKPLQHDQTLPLVQALGNLACRPSLVASLLTHPKPALIPLLQQILITAPSKNPVLVHGAWLARCLLVDVGIENHPSTTIAAPALIPVLIDRLGGNNSNGAIGGSLTLEEESEFASALWNALDTPPSADQSECTNQLLQTPSVQLPFELKIPRSTLQTLVRLINSSDTGAIFPGVHVVRLLLAREIDHHQNNLQVILQEEGVTDALERVCDHPMSGPADLAADILDDYFHSDDDDAIDEPSASASPWTTEASTSTTFAFGLPTDTQVPGGAGRGRGRGATMPAWMTK